MASINQNDGRKWINSAVAIGAALLAYVVFAFIQQVGDWFDLEAKITGFHLIGQGLAVLIGLTGFLAVTRNPTSSNFLRDVYGELSKVIWPDRDSVTRLTIGIIIGVSICSALLVAVDFLVQKLLSYLY